MANATLLYENLFSGTLGDVQKQMGCRADMYTLVTNFNGKATCVKVFQAGNQTCLEFGGGSSKHRAQLRHAYQNYYSAEYPNGLNLPTSDVGPWWYAYSQYIGPNTPNNSFQIISCDIKSGTADYGEPTIYFNGTNMQVRVNTGAIFNITVPIGSWFDVIWYMERRTGSTGVFRLWLNSTLQINYTGQTTIVLNPTTATSYFRTGIYWGSVDQAGDYTYYFTNVRIAKGGSDGYALVDPTQTQPPTDPDVTASITITQNTTAASVNLTAVGTADWAHWGLTTLTDLNVKSGGAGLFSALSGTWLQSTTGAQLMTWTDGTPTASATDSTSKVRTNSSGSISVVADTTTRTLTLYLDARASVSTITCTIVNSTAAPQSITLDYPSSSANLTQLDIVYTAETTTTMTINFNIDSQYVAGGNIAINGASAVASAAPAVGSGAISRLHPVVRRFGLVGRPKRVYT